MRRIAKLALLLALIGFVAASVAWSGGQAAPAAAEERVKVTMFMGNSGVAQPAGVDPSDNWALKVIEDYANVDLELEIPNYSDYGTKCNLLLASGNLPDIIHSWHKADMIKAANAGAFIDLEPYWAKSPQAQKVVPELSMNLVKDETDPKFFWAMPMTHSGREGGWGVIVRYDLLKEYNGGKYPPDVEGYLDWFRWIKETYPDSIPVTSRNGGGRIFINSASIFAWHGGYPFWDYYRDGKVVNGLLLPQMRDAVKIYRQLYEEGLLDKEFATDTKGYGAKLREKYVATETNGTDQVVPIVDILVNKQGRHTTFAPPLERYPAGVDPQDIYKQSTSVWPINGGHRTAISASCKIPDRAWRALEGWASDELREVQAWGREGIEHNIVNGQRVPTDRLYFRDVNDPEEHYWTLHMGIIWGFWPTEAKYAVQKMKVPEEWQITYDSNRWLVEAAEKNGPGWGNFLPSMDEVNSVYGEEMAETSAILAKVISGEASMDDYDDMIADFRKKYGPLDDLRTKWINDHMDEMKAKGWKGN
jgi:ABC-type glycerol-3-phosphate transport system substrate-binding protein